MADDDRNGGPAEDRYFMHKALQQVQPSLTFVETVDGSDLLAQLESWSQQPTPSPVHLILPRRRTVRHEYAQG